MTPDEIIEAYNVLSQNVNDNAAQEAARIGNAQRSLGTLAERVASPANQTYGLANYTYDRVMRPTINATAKSLAVQGLASSLETNLSNALRAAKNRYEDARNRAAVSGGGGGGTNTGGNGNGNTTEEVTDNAYYGYLSDGGGGKSGGHGSTRSWGDYGPGTGDEDFEGDSYLVKRMGNEYHWGTLTENEYRAYLRNQGFDEDGINARVNFYRGKGSL